MRLFDYFIHSGFQFDLYLLYQAKLAKMKVLTIPVEFRSRRHGQSKWAFSLMSRFRLMWDTARYILYLRRFT